MTTQDRHRTVLLKEAVEALQVKADNWYIDATFGRGGHTQAILDQGGKVIAFDVDQEAITFGQTEFSSPISQGNLILIRENFEKLAAKVQELQLKTTIDQVQGILFDFGTSTEQLTSIDRGFSFESDRSLDMRMDQRLGVTALDLLNVLPENQLTQLFIEYGGEHEAKYLAKAIKKWLAEYGPAQAMTGKDLADLVVRYKREPRTKLHPATKVFQALRIAVNRELDSLQAGLDQVNHISHSGMRVVTIAFHEGEDRIVKHVFAQWEKQHRGQRINKEIMTPGAEEVEANPRSRSAKMRIFEYV